MANGNMSEITNIFNQDIVASNHPVSQQAIGNLTDKFAALGINAATAKSIGESIIPVILAKFASKTNDPNDSSFNLKDILGKLAGGDDGKFDLNDVLGMFKGNRQNQSDAPGGGMLDKLKGMFLKGYSILLLNLFTIL